MGRLPDMWANRRITMRVPYLMDGELTLTSGQSGVQFPDATFMNNVDKPFEIHRVIPRLTALDADGTALPTQPTQELLAELVRVLMTDIGKNSPMTKSPALIALLTKGSSERTWEWADPYYLIRSESIQIVCDALTFPVIQDFAAIRVEFAFQGFLIVVAPPSESR
jgi:hypothetical protein